MRAWQYLSWDGVVPGSQPIAPLAFCYKCLAIWLLIKRYRSWCYSRNRTLTPGSLPIHNNMKGGCAMLRVTLRVLSGVALLLVLPAPPADAASEPRRPVHTYSIVARDTATGELGVAVQSHWFSVGSGVLWAEPGIGAVATQSFLEPSYGPLGLALMRAGKT